MFLLIDLRDPENGAEDCRLDKRLENIAYRELGSDFVVTSICKISDYEYLLIYQDV